MIARLPADGNPALGMNTIARILRVAPRTAAKLVDSGRLGGYRIPGSKTRRVLQSELVAFVERNGLPEAMLAELTHGADAPGSPEESTHGADAPGSPEDVA